MIVRCAIGRTQCLWGVMWLLCLLTCSLRGEEPSANEANAEQAESEVDRFVDTSLELADVVLRQHIDPPTRQQMILNGVKAVFRAAGRSAPHDLARRVSGLGDEEAAREFLAEFFADVKKEEGANFDPHDVMLQGMLSAAPGGSRFAAADEYRVNQQLSENRYEGIGIAVSYDDERGLPIIQQAFPRGPARRAGAKSGDRIVSVDGRELKGKSLGEYVEMLRGERGTPVTIEVQQPGEREKRTLEMVRGVIPIETVVGRRRIDDDTWDYKAAADDAVAYLHIRSIRGSTASELRDAARKVQAAGFRAVIIDLRRTNAAEDLHHTVMLADALLPEGEIGKVQFAGKRRTFEARADHVLRDMPLVVLIDRLTQRDAEWLAAALKDRRRAILVGEETAGRGVTESTIALASGGAVTLTDGIFLHADGRAMLNPRPQNPPVPRDAPPGYLDPQDAATRNGVRADHHVDVPPGTRYEDALMRKAAELLKAQMAEAR